MLAGSSRSTSAAAGPPTPPAQVPATPAPLSHERGVDRLPPFTLPTPLTCKGAQARHVPILSPPILLTCEQEIKAWMGLGHHCPYPSPHPQCSLTNMTKGCTNAWLPVSIIRTLIPPNIEGLSPDGHLTQFDTPTCLITSHFPDLTYPTILPSAISPKTIVSCIATTSPIPIVDDYWHPYHYKKA